MGSTSGYCYLVVVIAFLPFCIAHEHHGQSESEAHGGRSPHERFREEHYKDGDHDDHLDHQAILGSKKAAEEFDRLSPEEAKKRLRVIADKMDVNKDRFVDKHELKTWIYKSLTNLDREEADERFDELDDDQNGHITFTEYVKDAFGEEDASITSGDIKLTPEDEKLFEEDQRFFRAADIDKDGKLTKDEFATFQNPESHSHMHETLIDNTLNDKDKNKDGFIDVEEFLGNYAHKKDSEWFQVENERFTNDYDVNKDGKLDRQEMHRWLVPNLDETAKEEMEHLFSEADKDHDAKLSMDEIVNEYNLFVGSEATNYGEHLEKLHHEEL